MVQRTARDVDELLARRVKYEMGRHDWSYGELAKRMADAGCPISKAAIHRIVNGNPGGGGPRGLSARELVALAAVLDTDMPDLMTPVELIEKERAKELIGQIDKNADLLSQTTGALLNMYLEYFELAADDHELWEYVHNHWFGSPSGDQEPQPLGVLEGASSFDQEEFNDRLRETTVNYVRALIGLAGDVAEQEVKVKRAAKAKQGSK